MTTPFSTPSTEVHSVEMTEELKKQTPSDERNFNAIIKCVQALIPKLSEGT